MFSLCAAFGRLTAGARGRYNKKNAFDGGEDMEKRRIGFWIGFSLILLVMLAVLELKKNTVIL